MSSPKSSGFLNSVLPAVLLAAVTVIESWAAMVHINSLAPFSKDSLLVLAWQAVTLGIPVTVIFALFTALASRLLKDARKGLAAAIALTLAGLLIACVVTIRYRFYDWSDLLRDHAVLLGFLVAWLALNAVMTMGPRLLGGAAQAAIAIAVACFLGISGASAPPPSAAEIRAMRSTSPPHPGLVLLIGVDGLSWDGIARWEKQKPNADFEWLRDRGYFGPLETIRPTASPEIWSTMATGGAPRDHGVIGFRSFQFKWLSAPRLRVPRLLTTRAWAHLNERLGLATQPIVSSYDLRMRSVWDVFAQNGQTVASIGWWASWPAQPTNGFIVSDKFYFFRDVAFDQQKEADLGPGMTFPQQLSAELQRFRVRPDDMTVEQIAAMLGKTPEDLESQKKVENFKPVWFDPITELRFGYTLDQTHEAIAKDFLRIQPPLGFLGVYLRGVDIVSHGSMCHSNLYPECELDPQTKALYGELVSNYYADAFARVRRIVEAAGEDALVMIVSDHGFEVETPSTMNHQHGPPGVLFVLNGKRDAKLDPPPSVYDVAPTLLWVKGFPVANDMPGRPLTELFAVPQPATVAKLPTYGYRSVNTVVGAGQTGDTDEEMMRLLRTLGYIK